MIRPVRRSGQSSRDREPDGDHPEGHQNSEFDQIFREIKNDD